ncbi:hypothetical protein DUNSADRAFT_15426 [Dunaliella salina]|uniref:Uncharacterized protein n=1 Tax=Dunaliella salina TaxID=3046 RepID=A0ABQ7G5K6_DUNSA|nr:hypothetical protein DUNSADRAFT_15426 [Dunaliella salina]|eukprot:KAF5829841.1 hypothetical protein DUNSADRAFT_15426 [Dunaliella salina]
MYTNPLYSTSNMSALPGSEVSTPADYITREPNTPKTCEPTTSKPPEDGVGLGQGRTVGAEQLQTSPAQWLWLLLNGMALLCLYAYVLLPYRLAYFLSPSFFRPSLKSASVQTWEGVALPLTTAMQQASFWVLSQLDAQVDDVWRRTSNTHKANMNHFRVAFEGYLRLIERKAAIVEQHGLAGIPKALFER